MWGERKKRGKKERNLLGSMCEKSRKGIGIRWSSKSTKRKKNDEKQKDCRKVQNETKNEWGHLQE